MYGSIHNILACLFFDRMMHETCYSAATAEEKRIESGRQAYGFIIPAGALIGLGAGLLVDHAGIGILIGLGLGFIGSGLVPLVRKPHESEGTHTENANVTLLLIGAFLVFIGIGSVWAPAALWPYAIAGFLMLIGTWLLVRGFRTTS